MKSIHHSFDIDLAEEYGIEAAILIHHFQYWITINKRKSNNNYDGRTWMYQTTEDIAAHFPYFSLDKVKDILDLLCTGKTRKMKEAKFEPILMKGNYNKTKFDRTIWYSFVDEEKWINKEKNTTVDMSIMEKREEPLPKWRSPLPIPDTKTESITDTKKDSVRTVSYSTSKKDFVKCLKPDQKELHDKLIQIPGLDSPTICAWFLSRKWTAQQVLRGLEVYQQDLQEGAKITNPGGYICKAIQKKRRPKTSENRFNMEYARLLAQTHKCIEITKRYIKVVAGNLREEIYFALPKNQFTTQLDNLLKKAELYS